MKRFCLFVLTLMMFSLSANCGAAEEATSSSNGQVPGPKSKNMKVFQGRSFKSKGDTMYYLATYPTGYTKESKKKYPLVVVLHAADAYGIDSEKANNHVSDSLTLSPVANLFKRQSVMDSFPAVVVFPQASPSNPWASFGVSGTANVVPFPEKPEQTTSGRLVQHLVRYYTKHYPIDKNRVYIVGLGTTGGSGALDLAARNPKMFAAVASLGGAVNPKRAVKLKKVPLRLYSTEAIVDVPLTLVRDVYIELKIKGSKTVEEVIEFANGDEFDCVRAASGKDDFLSWIFSKSR